MQLTREKWPTTSAQQGRSSEEFMDSWKWIYGNEKCGKNLILKTVATERNARGMRKRILNISAIAIDRVETFWCQSRGFIGILSKLKKQEFFIGKISFKMHLNYLQKGLKSKFNF